MSYRLIDANALNGVISNDDYEKVLNAPCIFADLPNGLDNEHYNLQEPKSEWEYDHTILKAYSDGANEVLDRVRAEISALKSHHINDCYDDGFQCCRTNVLYILDKYKAESEESEKWVNFADDLIPIIDEAESEDK